MDTDTLKSIATTASLIVAAITSSVAWVFKTIESKNRLLIESLQQSMADVKETQDKTESRAQRLESLLVEQHREHRDDIAIQNRKHDECMRDRDALRCRIDGLTATIEQLRTPPPSLGS